MATANLRERSLNCTGLFWRVSVSVRMDVSSDSGRFFFFLSDDSPPQFGGDVVAGGVLVNRMTFFCGDTFVVCPEDCAVFCSSPSFGEGGGVATTCCSSTSLTITVIEPALATAILLLSDHLGTFGNVFFSGLLKALPGCSLRLGIDSGVDTGVGVRVVAFTLASNRWYDAAFAVFGALAGGPGGGPHLLAFLGGTVVGLAPIGNDPDPDCVAPVGD